MARWRPLQSLHVRLTGLFLLLLALSAGGYYLWVDATVFQPGGDEAAEHWWSDLSDAEIDSLAVAVAGDLEAPDRLRRQLREYGRRVTPFEAEVAVVDTAGRILASTQPDTLTAAVADLDLDTGLLAEMAAPGWDYESYPDPEDFDSYVNRIFEVKALADPATGESAAWLVATFASLTITPEELAVDVRTLWLQAIAVILATAAVSGVLAMLWLSRRLHVLSRGVGSYAAGNLAFRVPARSGDEIGRLGRDFNTMAERLARLIEELQNKERFQRQLIANISHDLRTPMASLRGYIETLALRGKDMAPEQTREYLAIVTSNLDHLDRLIDHLLQLSRLDAGQARFQMEDFPLPELLDGVIDRCTPVAEAKDVALRIEAPDDLPLVHADPLQIAQVLQNLVDNGVKFNRTGGEVVVVLRRHAGGVQVVVRDDGPGIPPEVMPHVFDRFYAGDESRSRKGECNGLGLSISKMIVGEHGAELTVESEVGRGAAFSFVLPAASGGEEHELKAEG